MSAERWAICYDDGTVWDNEDVAGAPTHGVIAIVQQLDEAHPQVLHTADFYWWFDSMWWAGDLAGFLDSSGRGASWLKQGRTVRTATFRDVLGRASEIAREWDR